MLSDGRVLDTRDTVRRGLLKQYVCFQRGLMEADPASPHYHTAIQSFRQMGYALIAAGFEDDLGRLLRIRVLEGGQPRRAGAARSSDYELPEMYVLESRPIAVDHR